MGKSQRDKGKLGEREVAHILQDYGYNGRRTQQFSGKEGTSDVVGLPGFHIEVKRHERYAIREWLQQAEEDARPTDTPCVVFRASREPWRIVMGFKEFLGILRGRDAEIDILRDRIDELEEELQGLD